MSRWKKRMIPALCAAALSQGAPAALACAACAGQSNDRMAVGMNMGIFALLLVISCVLAGVASFFVFIARRGTAPLPDGEWSAPSAQNPTHE